MDFRQHIESKLYSAGLTYETDASGIKACPKNPFPNKNMEMITGIAHSLKSVKVSLNVAQYIYLSPETFETTMLPVDLIML